VRGSAPSMRHKSLSRMKSARHRIFAIPICSILSTSFMVPNRALYFRNRNCHSNTAKLDPPPTVNVRPVSTLHTRHRSVASRRETQPPCQLRLPTHDADPNLLMSAGLALAVRTISGQPGSRIFALLFPGEEQTRLRQIVALQQSVSTRQKRVEVGRFPAIHNSLRRLRSRFFPVRPIDVPF
jgi:hypothetical protein